MLVSENLSQFKRGRDPKRSLDVGMTRVWPEIVKLIQIKMGRDWDVFGDPDEYDDTYYIYAGYYDEDGLSFDGRINTDEKTIWGQRSIKEPDHGKDLSGTKRTKMVALKDSGGSNEEIASEIAEQLDYLKNNL